MAELKTSYMDIGLENPILVSSSGITGSLDGLERCAEAGAGAVVLKSMFEELIVAGSEDLDRSLVEADHPEALDYVRAELGMRLGPLPYLEFVERARRRVSIPVIASINCVSPHWWVPYARRVESAGASALELNISHFPQRNAESFESIEKRYAEIVAKVTQSITIPVAVKMGFYFTSLWNVMEEVVDAGARALVLFNRYHSVDVDLDTKQVVPAVKLSSPAERLLPLRWIGLAARELSCDIAASTGLHDAEGVIKALMMGAQVVQVCSALYRNGPGYLQELSNGVSTWLDREGFASVQDITGLALKNTPEDTALLTRLQYIKALEEASEVYKF